MQTSREPTRQKRSSKRRYSRKKSLSPSDLKRARDEPKEGLKANGKRSLSEGSAKSKHRKSNIRRTLTHPLYNDDVENVDIDINSDKISILIPTMPPESDESNIPPTSSDRDTEDDQRVPNLVPMRPRWDSGSEMDSIVSIVKKASARRRRTPSNQELALSSEAGETSGAEARMRPDDYRLVFLSSDSSREDDSSSTASSVPQTSHDDCDWDYFEPGAPSLPLPPPPPPPPACQRACSCGAEPRIVAVPVPVPVPVPAALWPTTWPPAPHWHTYPGFPPLDAAALARLVTQDKASQATDATDNDADKIASVARDPPDGAAGPSADEMPNHLEAEKAFHSSEDSCSSNDENDGARRSYDLTSGAPEEPATTDEDSDDSGGGGGQFSRVFVVNPTDSSSDIEDDAESSGIDCDDCSDRKLDNVDAVAVEVAQQNQLSEPKTDESIALAADSNSSVVLVESNQINETFVISRDSNCADSGDVKSNFMKFCDENMLHSEICENFNSFKATNGDESDNVDSCNRSRTSSENYECDSLDPMPNVRESEALSEEENSKSLESREISLRSKLSPEKIDLFKGIERTLSELLKQESSEEKPGAVEEGAVGSGSGADATPVQAVNRARLPRPDVARFTSRVMITHDDVVLASDTRVTVSHAQPQPDVTVVSNADTLSAVVCLEEGLADDDSWVEDVSHDSDPTDSDSEDEASLSPRTQELAYCRRSIDFTLHTIVEESSEESEAENGPRKKARPISATELEKYFFFGLGDGRNFREDEDQASETSSICSEGGESIVDNDQPERRGDEDDLVSSRLEKYFLSGLMGFSQERNDSDGSGSVGSDSEGKQSPEHRRKRLVRARGTPRSHSSSLDNLIGDEASQDNQEASDCSSTETEDQVDSTERLDPQGENKRKKQGKKTRGSPADEKRLSTEFAEESRDETRSVSEGEDGKATPRPEFPPMGTELSEAKKQTSRDSGFVGSCDDLLRNGDSNSDYNRSHEPKIELEEIIEENRPDIEERIEVLPTSRPPPSPLVRKDSFNNWSSDEETNLMMTKMRQFFKQMVNSNVRANTPTASTTESSKTPKPPQLVYFENELTRLMKTVPGIRDEEVREIVEYLSSEDTWSDSYDSSDYAGSDLEGTTVTRLALRKQISDSCREIIDEFDRGNSTAGSLERDAAGAYRKLAATLGRAGEGSPPLFGKVIRHIGGRLVALMHEVSAGASVSTDDDSASEPGALARSRSHDILEATASRGSVASDCERFSWRGSFESALLAADSRGTLEARRSPAELGQRSHSRSCGAIGGSEDRLWRGRRRASAPDAEPEEEQRSGSLPRLPSVAGNTTVATGPVKSARYRAPGFRTATRAASAPGLHAPRRRRPPHASHLTPPSAPASAPSLQDEVYSSEALSTGHATLPRLTKSPMLHDRDNDSDRLSSSKSSLQIGRSESMASVYSGAGEGTRSSVTVRGEVQFSLLYNYRLGALEVGVKRCRDLAPVDIKKNRSDPYVKVYLLPDKSKAGKRKTKVKKNTLNPVWEETLSFIQPLASLSARTLWLSVWHADMFGRNDFLGEVTLPLHDVVFDDPQPAWYKLTERTEQFDEQQGSRGDIIIGLKLDISERGKGTLHVLVKEAKGLIAAKPNGLADVFCKGYLLPDRGRLAKQKTSVVRRTLNPKWEHTFVYRGLTLQELSHRALELSLWDRDRLASNDFMGAVRLSLGQGTYMGASVNWMDSVGKEVTLWQTMLQRPNFWVEGSLPLRSYLSN